MLVEGVVALALASAQADLRIAYWADGRGGAAPALRWTLRCGPPGGTLPRRAEACRRLLALERPFAPTPKDVACAELYGGPGEALVTGMFRGRRVWALFTRRDGCAIERWSRHAFLWGGRSGSAA